MNTVIRTATALIMLATSASAPTLDVGSVDFTDSTGARKNPAPRADRMVFSGSPQFTAIDNSNMGIPVGFDPNPLVNLLLTDSTFVGGDGSTWLGDTKTEPDVRVDLTDSAFDFVDGSDDQFPLSLDSVIITPNEQPRPFRIAPLDVTSGGFSGFTPQNSGPFGTTGTVPPIDDQNTPATIPIPASLPLLAMGLGALGLAARRRKA